MATLRPETARTTRNPIQDGFRSKLTVKGKDPDYEYRIVTDRDMRIADFEAAGWEKVTDPSVEIGERRVGIPKAESSARTVSVGGGDTGVLMKIKKEWWEEIQAVKNKRASDAVAQTIQDAKDSADYVKISRT